MEVNGQGRVETDENSDLLPGVIALIGDGALTGGMAYEALNNASRLETNFIIILNDNNMSISENVGGVSEMEVELCPVSKQSHSLSLRFGKPLMPPNFRKLAKPSLLPVKILCVYDWPG